MAAPTITELREQIMGGFRHLLLAMIRTFSKGLTRSENAMFIHPNRHDLKIVVGRADEDAEDAEWYADLVRQDEINNP